MGGYCPKFGKWTLLVFYFLLQPLFQGHRKHFFGSIEIDIDYYNNEIENDIKRFMCEKDNSLNSEAITIIKMRTPEAQLIKGVTQKKSS